MIEDTKGTEMEHAVALARPTWREVNDAALELDRVAADLQRVTARIYAAAVAHQRATGEGLNISLGPPAKELGIATGRGLAVSVVLGALSGGSIAHLEALRLITLEHLDDDIAEAVERYLPPPSPPQRRLSLVTPQILSGRGAQG